MPTVKNNGTVAYYVGNILISADDTQVTSQYPDPELTDLEVTSNTPRSGTPILVFADRPSGNSVDALATYDWIRVFNDSGANVSIALNGDTTNALVYPTGSIDNLDNRKKKIGYLAATGSGNGTVHIWGW